MIGKLENKVVSLRRPFSKKWQQSSTQLSSSSYQRFSISYPHERSCPDTSITLLTPCHTTLQDDHTQRMHDYDGVIHTTTGPSANLLYSIKARTKVDDIIMLFSDWDVTSGQWPNFHELSRSVFAASSPRRWAIVAAGVMRECHLLCHMGDDGLKTCWNLGPDTECNQLISVSKSDPELLIMLI